MNNQEASITVLYINTRGQTKFSVQKQLCIQDLCIKLKCDVVHLQETDTDENVFEHCPFINENYVIISNNSTTGYGTCSIVKNDLKVENIFYDTNGRVIIFDISGVTFSNIYLEAGTDADSRNARENYLGEVLPNLLINRCQTGCIGGDWNCIILKKDATNYPETKMSKNLSKLTKIFKWQDSHLTVNPGLTDFSHYYVSGNVQGATRIDRQYLWGDATAVSSEYFSVPFSDHYGLLTKVKVPLNHSRQAIPRAKRNLKIRNEIVDAIFVSEVAKSMKDWQKVRENGLDVVRWWDLIVKPGIRRIAIERSKSINQERNGEINMLFIKQAYLVQKLKTTRSSENFENLKTVQDKINSWYELTAKKIQDQSRQKEFQESEPTRIYHHEIHKKFIKRGSILRLETDQGLLEGHENCAKYLEGKVQELLGYEANLNLESQNKLLENTFTVFSNEDNLLLEAKPTKKEIIEVLSESNLKASAGSDGIPSIVYKACWDSLGDSLHDVFNELFAGQPLPASMRTAMMVFTTKPKKPDSIKPSDKRRVSVLNCDFKLYEGLIAKRFRKMTGHVLSPHQYACGKNRNINHGIARARDAIHVASQKNLRCGIGDQDYIAAFDYLVLPWVWKVLKKKGVNDITIKRLENLYENGLTIPVINGMPRKAIKDVRKSLRQGGLGSIDWFSFGIDPLLIFLELNLTGILICSMPVMGPADKDESYPLPHHQERFKVIGYVDDIKPAICSLEEFNIADKGAALFESAAGTKLHRDPNSNKCKFLPLGKWRNKLQQEDIPTPYMKITDTLDMVGVQLCSTWGETRAKNGDAVSNMVSQRIGAWMGGKYMPLTQRPYSVNTYALSKVWFRSASINFREKDFKNINSSIKQWLYRDLPLKPEEAVLFRPVNDGGLGLTSVKHKSLAMLIHNFIDLAANPAYINSLFLKQIYVKHVLGEDVECPTLPQYFKDCGDFFETMKNAMNDGKDIVNMTTKDWYSYILHKNLFYTKVNGVSTKSLCRIERLKPDWNFPEVWASVRMASLPSQTTTFLWKLAHELIPSEGRLSACNFGGNTSPFCKKDCIGDKIANYEHIFFRCSQSKDIGEWLLSKIRGHSPSLVTPESILSFRHLDNDAIAWITAKTLQYIWEKRIVPGGRTSVEELKNQMKRDLNAFENTKFQNTYVIGISILDSS